MSNKTLRKIAYKHKTLKNYDQKEIKDNIKEINVVSGDQRSSSLLFKVNSRFNFNHAQKHELILMAPMEKNFSKTLAKIF